MDENNHAIVGTASKTVSYTTAGDPPPDDVDGSSEPGDTPTDDPSDDPESEEPEERESAPNVTDFTTTQRGSTAALSWAPGNDPNIGYQNIKRRERGKGDWTATRVAKDAGSNTDSDVEHGKKYIYHIESWSSDGKKIGLSRPAKDKMR